MLIKTIILCKTMTTATIHGMMFIVVPDPFVKEILKSKFLISQGESDGR